MPNVLSVKQGKLSNGQRVILQDLNFEIPQDQCTVILGPSGTGKSLLLHAIANTSDANVKTGGEWAYQAPKSEGATKSPILPQAKNHNGHKNTQVLGHLDRVDHWRQALDSKREIIYLDEPFLGRYQSDVDDFVTTFKSMESKATTVIVTHNQQLARAVGDRIILLCAGRIESSGPVTDFFEQPSTDLTAQFLRTGNCWPKPKPPELPKHFCWIIPDQLAGMGRPGLMRDVDEDLSAIGQAGITDLISLTEKPFPVATLSTVGIQGRHFPIKDMCVPSLNSTATLVGRTVKRIEQGRVVAYHCKAGLGRTGTLLACHLAWLGYDPGHAIEKIRSIQPGFIQNKSQYDFVYQFAKQFCKVDPTTNPIEFRNKNND